MLTVELLSLVTFILALLCALISFVVLAVLGRTRMKVVDKYIYGHAFEHDSIFFQMARLPQYILVFSSRWYAKRTGQLEFYEHFDKKFKQPFLVAYLIVLFGVVMMVLSWVITEYYI
ncbi:MAG TPA: hypothetical protein ENI64_04145 [Gammaproteobacteria bacterium]|nr:hypothetical protein [Gammaproteobacteria bacterium]